MVFERSSGKARAAHLTAHYIQQDTDDLDRSLTPILLSEMKY
jgi:hypothetical protein